MDDGALPAAGALAYVFPPGASVLCSSVDEDAVVLETTGEGRIRIPLERARLVQVERVGVAV